jgi:hypothetical protein
MTMGVTPAAGEDLGGDLDEALAEEARVAADEHTMRRGLGLDVGGNAGHCQPDVGDGEVFGNNRPPTGGAKLDRGSHGFLSAASRIPPCVWKPWKR